MTRRRISEVASYVWIKNKFRDLGWNTNSPSRDPNGQIYTQQECRDHEALRDSLAGEFPEYIVKLCNHDIDECHGKTDDRNGYVNASIKIEGFPESECYADGSAKQLKSVPSFLTARRNGVISDVYFSHRNKSFHFGLELAFYRNGRSECRIRPCATLSKTIFFFCSSSS